MSWADAITPVSHHILKSPIKYLFHWSQNKCSYTGSNSERDGTHNATNSNNPYPVLPHTSHFHWYEILPHSTVSHQWIFIPCAGQLWSNQPKRMYLGRQLWDILPRWPSIWSLWPKKYHLAKGTGIILILPWTSAFLCNVLVNLLCPRNTLDIS